eukprot:CAMPEP_0113933780 /NCGR_PEP_ID=MMETSP1339-20121228/1104_1 /TAXON_ID=94617 /ORGANISM="Fibrocapsa japonica" /LENGTH=239 /DNA_ID=CAMNT_0000935247 /DNA_START=80 /DNA_END=799 /DNA_ORIENTATION=+ /assembly_acc=CAM_ASM_000762
MHFAEQASIFLLLFVGSALSFQSTLHNYATQKASRTVLDLSGTLDYISTAGSDVSLDGKVLWLNFKGFGFGNRTCRLDLDASGQALFSERWETREPGAWRVEDAEPEAGEPAGAKYLQFSCPLTKVYQESFTIASDTVFWRAQLVQKAQGVELVDGVIISEKPKWFGLGVEFVKEGTFKGRVLKEDEEYPLETTFVPEILLEEKDIDIFLARQKTKRAKENEDERLRKEGLGKSGELPE